MGRDLPETVLITGSSGFLGQAIARGLLERYRVIGLDVTEPKSPLPGMDTFRIDLTSDEDVANAMRKVRDATGGRIASVVHLAAYYDTAGEDNPKYDQVTVQGTRRLLDQLKRLECEQFLFSSTMLVHKAGERGVRIDETWPLDPLWAYPRSKALTERLILEERGPIKSVVMRFAGVYDEDGRAAFIAQQIARIVERLPTAFLFTGDLDNGQPYVHVDDLVDAVVRAVDRRRELPDEVTLLIGEEETPSYREMQEGLAQLIHDETWPILSLPKGFARLGAWMQEEVLDEDTYIRSWMVENSDVHYELDISRARSLLGWEPKHSLIGTLPEMVRRLKADPPGWYAKNKLNPAVVAASGPELEKADERLDKPLERSREEVEAAIDRHRAFTLWAPLLNAALGLWLIASAFMYGLFDGVAGPPAPALGHELPPPAVRDAWLGWSDIVSGVLIFAFSLAGMSPRRRWLQWIPAAVGCWLLLAPLVLWTTSPAAYAVDTLIGILVVVFAVMVPPQPGIALRALASDDDRPLGWSYSPSTWTQRLPIIALSLVGLFVSRYLAAYQMGHIEGLWDPFFGPGDPASAGAAPQAQNGSETVVTSWLSKGFPIPDAGLGAAAYALDILAGAIGDRRRWRTMPWLVFLFGLLIVPLGIVSLTFVIVQPPWIGTLCTLCIVQAAVTLLLIPYSIDELLATAQYLRRATRAGEPFWRTFWMGGPALSKDQTPAPDLDRPATAVLKDFITGGVNFPWTLVATCAVGVWLMATPLILATELPLYHSNHILGCLIIGVAVTAMAEIARAVRFLNVALGAWIAVSPFVLGGDGTLVLLNQIVAGALVILLSLPRGTRSEETYGGWDRLIV